MTNRLIHTSDDLPPNHWIARQLPPGTSLRPFAEDEAVSAITSAVQGAIDEAGLTRADVARLLGTTKSYISQVLNGSTNMTLKTLGALLWAAGREVAGLLTQPLGAAPNVIRFPSVTASAPNPPHEAFTPLVRVFVGHVSTNERSLFPNQWRQ